MCFAHPRWNFHYKKLGLGARTRHIFHTICFSSMVLGTGICSKKVPLLTLVPNPSCFCRGMNLMVAGRVWGTSPRSSTLFVADIFCHILTSCQTKMQRQICRRRVIAKCSRYRVHMIHRMIILARSSFVLDISRRISLIGNADPTWVPECLLGHDLWLWLWPDGSSMLMENPSYPSINGRRLRVAGSSRKPPQCLCV